MLKTMVGSAFLGVTLLLGPFTTGIRAQEGANAKNAKPPAVSGQVIGEDDAFVSGTKVRLKGVTNTRTEPFADLRTTDAQGAYEFASLSQGEYVISVTADEHEAVERRISLDMPKRDAATGLHDAGPCGSDQDQRLVGPLRH